MAKFTMFVGFVLVVVSLSFWFSLGRADMAALHPAGLGVLMLVAGALANSEDAKRRMLWMHIAVTLGLIGLLITGIRAVLELAHGTTGVHPLAFDERAIVAVVCLIFVAVCVRSFIAARRSRTA
jgi:hypothetical protein